MSGAGAARGTRAPSAERGQVAAAGDRRRREGTAVLGPEWAEQVRLAAETMAVGVLVVLFSLPLVTAGAAWCAAAEITAGWHRQREPALLRTFARTVRRDLLPGFAVQCAVLAVAAVALVEVRVVLASRLPGYPVEAAALALLGAGAVAFALFTVACRAAGPGSAPRSWGDALRTAGRRVRSAPATLVLVVAACACVAALIAVIPAFAGFMAGPLAYAVSVVAARGSAGAGAE
ncbi:hypothetical protein GCM10018793_33130 [Streptomyces sulfonofaciens]|uniref:DUF624 domain-containing protein n=1 Tax=Streptomyces sulfonofaciens TaxID=68272 RepID=A0A919G9E0_9ACTN|nr:DUF624 domain-containing protein [Streptomyces sulfonofaciens]GHH79680.1 hypothetical protein GCM10018793_33130 [Streptomyces sulfonofaciens]